MLPLYGWTAAAVFIVFSLGGIYLIRRSKASQGYISPRTQVLSVAVFLIAGISLYFVLQAKEEKHRVEIITTIEARGGEVLSIQPAEKGETPFKGHDSVKARSKDDYFIVTYRRENETKTAWFKGDNALYRDPPTPTGEKWIFE
ncbi:hypothetical protein ACVNS2_09355 [Paenibacillus caseinilyticus]|uniref:Uncharacterized protein n=1 Tax=Paenibacillus mucilaginosus K02 TaxID=997761 RepID=I0BEQ1_9BACL|nr:hypothetical protein [Paenibacillus mucilaginosus]AFH60848.1 hypothetical protein B2K_08970 [Paenibacillus mucilaginosus K02]